MNSIEDLETKIHRLERIYNVLFNAVMCSMEYIQRPQVFDLISPEQAALHDILNCAIYEATGKTFEKLQED